MAITEKGKMCVLSYCTHQIPRYVCVCVCVYIYKIYYSVHCAASLENY